VVVLGLQWIVHQAPPLVAIEPEEQCLSGFRFDRAVDEQQRCDLLPQLFSPLLARARERTL
jgi:hypothetical protein